MQNFSNLLRQRLGAIPEPQAHPDPDALSAYAEQVLTPAERQKIQEHLAACSPCREVVALSLPEMQEEQVVLRPAARSWALGLRWAALAAMIMVIIGLAVQQPWKEKGPGQGTFTTALDTAAKTADTATAAKTIAPPAPSAAEPQAAPASATHSSLQPAMTMARRGQSEAVSAAKPAAPPVDIPRTLTASRVASPAVVGGVATRTAGPANWSANNGSANNNLILDSSNNSLVSAPTPKAEAPLSMADAFTPSRATPPISASDIGSTAMGVTPDKENKSLAAAPVPATSSPGKIHQAWSFVATIPHKVAGASSENSSSSGAAAFSAGHVRFDPHSAVAERTASKADASQLRSSQLHWSISPDGKLIKSENRDQWHEAYTQDQDLQFRTVWTDPNGHEIWAGGSHLTIIHSWNGGVNWQKMKLDEAAGSGDITNISIDDGNVQVKTSNGQTFVSHDKGVTWVPLKQPSQTNQLK